MIDEIGGGEEPKTEDGHITHCSSSSQSASSASMAAYNSGYFSWSPGSSISRISLLTENPLAGLVAPRYAIIRATWIDQNETRPLFATSPISSCKRFVSIVGASDILLRSSWLLTPTSDGASAWRSLGYPPGRDPPHAMLWRACFGGGGILLADPVH